jgi:hypothetical protein
LCAFHNVLLVSNCFSKYCVHFTTFFHIFSTLMAYRLIVTVFHSISCSVSGYHMVFMLSGCDCDNIVALRGSNRFDLKLISTTFVYTYF